VIIAAAAVVIVTQTRPGHSVDNGAAVRTLESARAAMMAHQRTCPASAGQLDCLHQTAGELSLAFRDFDIAVDRIHVSASAIEAQNTVEDDAELLSNAYDELAVAPTTAAYQRVATRDDVATLTSQFDQHYAALVEAIRAG
jgi:hypothetical protein